MKKELGGIPVWIYAVGAAVVIGGYLWFKHSQSAAPAQPAAPGGSAPSTSTSTFSETIKNLQSNPKPKKKKTG